MSQFAQIRHSPPTATRPAAWLAAGWMSAVRAWRSWRARPGNLVGLALSCLLHGLLSLVLAFCVWAAPRPDDNDGIIASAFERSEGAAVEFELSSTEPVGGGGGPTALVADSDATWSRVAPGISFEPRMIPLALPEVPIAGLNPGPGHGRGVGTGTGDGTGSRKPPGKNAVTEGSFTVWTIPDDPLPGETYTIMIEVKLPPKITRYPRSDLLGLVTGTDGWLQPLPGNATPLQPYLPIEDHAVQLQVDVPGAARRIRDTIELRSRLLKEKQVLTITF